MSALKLTAIHCICVCILHDLAEKFGKVGGQPDLFVYTVCSFPGLVARISHSYTLQNRHYENGHCNNGIKLQKPSHSTVQLVRSTMIRAGVVYSETLKTLFY